MFKTDMTKDYIFNFIEHNTNEVKKLLDEKGFGYDINEFIVRSALLHTEVAELTDAIKKGKGDDEEGGEVADIIIRLLNFTCMFPDLLPGNLNISSIKDEIHYSLPEEIMLTAKYRTTYELHAAVKELCERLESYSKMMKANGIDEDTLNKMKQNTLKIAFAFFSSVIMMCNFYCENFLSKNLQELVNEKMAINYGRPYRYNTSEEHFK